METAPLEAGYRSQSRGSTAASPAGIRIDIPPPPNLPWGGSNYDNSRFYTAKGYLPPEPEPVSEQPTPSSQTSSHSGALPSPAGSRASEGKPQVAGVQPSLRASATLGTLMEQLGSETKVGPPERAAVLSPGTTARSLCGLGSIEHDQGVPSSPLPPLHAAAWPDQFEHPQSGWRAVPAGTAGDRAGCQRGARPDGLAGAA